MQSREGVIGDLRFRVRNRSDQSRLAGVGHAEQPHIGQHPQFEPEAELLAGPTGRFLSWRSVGAGLEVQVAEATIPAFSQQHFLIGYQQLGHHFVGVRIGDDRAHRHAQQDVFSRGPELVGPAAVFAPPSFMPARVAKVDQRVQIAVADGIDTASSTAVTAIRPAERDELFAPKAHASITAIACSNVYRGFVYKFHRRSGTVESKYKAGGFRQDRR
jgi:hypothetical protein